MEEDSENKITLTDNNTVEIENLMSYRKEDSSSNDPSETSSIIQRKSSLKTPSKEDSSTDVLSSTMKGGIDTGENLKVFIRVRPAIDREIDPEVPFQSIVSIGLIQ